jgi:predicted RNA-binding Zn-ribbon protein involved in translation (DUF1610 family)
MTIEFRCGSCQTLLRTGDDKAGRRAKCPQCGAEVATPAKLPAADFEEFEEYDETDEFTRHFGGGGPTTYVKPKAETGRRVPCPMCGESIAAAARRCRHCGEVIGGASAYQPTGYAPTAGSSVASLVLGIVGLLTFCFWFITLPCSLLAVGLGIVGIRASRSGQYRGEGMAIAGLVLGALGLLFCIAVYGFFFAAIKGGF